MIVTSSKLQVQNYDPATGTWTPAGSLVEEHTRHAATLLPNGLVLIEGGITLDAFTKDAGAVTILLPARGVLPAV